MAESGAAERELDWAWRQVEAREAELERARREKAQLEQQVEGLSRRVSTLQSELDRTIACIPVQPQQHHMGSINATLHSPPPLSVGAPSTEAEISPQQLQPLHTGYYPSEQFSNAAYDHRGREQILEGRNREAEARVKAHTASKQHGARRYER